MKLALMAFFLAALMAGCARDRQSGMGATTAGSESVTGVRTEVEDSTFARQACQAGAAEVEIARLAERNTKNKAVRSFAQKLAEDHARAEKELSRLFARKGIPPETEFADDLQSSVQRLAGLKGGQFDEAFKRQVIEDHKRAIELFEDQAEHGTDPELKAFAQKHLPHLREHLETAQGLPISSDSEGPAQNSVNRILQNPATPVTVPR